MAKQKSKNEPAPSSPPPDDPRDRDRTGRDRVDESGEESFPASDPPSWTAGCEDGDEHCEEPEPPGSLPERR